MSLAFPMKYKCLIGLVFLLLLAYGYANIKYPKHFNITVVNHTNSTIEELQFATVQGMEDLILGNIAPQETLYASRDFAKTSDSFLVSFKNSNGAYTTLPLAYVYTPNAKNIVELHITETHNGKITEVTIKSFDSFPTLLPPWWIRQFYDYSESTYPL